MNTHKLRYQVEVIINEQPTTMFADTGADVCVMSLENAEKLQLPLNRTRMKIRPFGSKSVRCKGSYIGPAMYGNAVANVCIYVVDKKVETLLSGPASEELGIIKLHTKAKANTIRCVDQPAEANHPQNLFPELFSGTGILNDYQVKLHIDENVRPVAEPPRPIPFHLQHRHREEINHMEEVGVIEEHHGPAPWVSNTVIALKDDGVIRLTVDMRNPNKAIQPTNLPIPRAEEVRARLAGCRLFSKCDFKTAFHQLELDPDSRYITVFHDGNNRLMRYTRLTMGTSPASGELNKALTPLFRDLPGAHVIHDDLILATEKEAQHEDLLKSVMEVIAKSGMTLNPGKCHFRKSSIPFWGMIISADGVRPDPAKVDALRSASQPRNKSEVMSFLCMVQSNAEFIPGLSQKTENLRALTKKHARFSWTKECQAEFKSLRDSLHEDAVLRYYDQNDPTYLFVDAHNTGLAALLCQGKTPDTARVVACASRTTTGVERRYPQIDLESMAIDFALRRYRQYLVGGPIVPIFTDHKPLVAIFNSKRKGSVRTQRIQLRHQDIPYSVQWQPGKFNPADYLSRHATPLTDAPKTWRKETHELEKTIWCLQLSPYTEAVSMDRILKETTRDATLKQLTNCLQRGRIPGDMQNLNPYRKVLDELTTSEAGLILKGERIVLPEMLWKTAVEKAHQGGHPGTSGLKRRIRTHFWFPKMDQVIEEKVAACAGCQLFTKKTTKALTSPQRTPNKVWEEVNIDLFGPMPNNKHILVAQDGLSRFPAATVVSSTAAKPVLKALDNIYGNYGNPEAHRTDNGPPFNSAAFEEFSMKRGIDHKKVYEYHPQGNPAETFMKPLGKAVKIANLNKMPVEQAVNDLLSAYRSTPHPATGEAPGEMMFRHGYKGDFPRREVSETEMEAARQHDQRQKEERQQKVNSSVRHRESLLVPGQRVLIANEKRRSKFDPLYEPHEYVVINCANNDVIAEREDGVRRRRHINDVKPIPSSYSFSPPRRKVHLWSQSTAASPQPDQARTTTAGENSQEANAPLTQQQMPLQPSPQQPPPASQQVHVPQQVTLAAEWKRAVQAPAYLKDYVM